MRATPSQPPSNDPVIRSQNRLVRYMAISLLVGVGVVLVFVLFPGLGETRNFVALGVAAPAGKPMVVSLYTVTGYSEDDGAYLRAYELEAIDPAAPKSASTIRFDRPLDFKPTDPQLQIDLHDGIWVVLPSQSLQDTTGYLRRVALAADGTLSDSPVPALKGYQPKANFVGQHLSLRNNYNEEHCYDLDRQALSPGYCPWEPTRPSNTRFFLVQREAGSTRSRLWVAQALQPVPEAQISVGFTEGDRPLEGTHLFSDLSMNRDAISEERLAYHVHYNDSTALRMRRVSGPDYFVDATLAYQDSLMAILRLPGASPDAFQLQAIAHDGRLLWKLDLDFPKRGYAPMQVRDCGGVTAVWEPENWAIGIDKALGKAAWRHVP